MWGWINCDGEKLYLRFFFLSSKGVRAPMPNGGMRPGFGSKGRTRVTEPHHAGQRSQDLVAHCLIIWTSPEINFDAQCLRVSGSGRRGGGGERKRGSWSAAPVGEMCQPHAEIPRRAPESVCICVCVCVCERAREREATPTYSRRSHSSPPNMLNSYSTHMDRWAYRAGFNTSPLAP